MRLCHDPDRRREATHYRNGIDDRQRGGRRDAATWSRIGNSDRKCACGRDIRRQSHGGQLRRADVGRRPRQSVDVYNRATIKVGAAGCKRERTGTYDLS